MLRPIDDKRRRRTQVGEVVAVDVGVGLALAQLHQLAHLLVGMDSLAAQNRQNLLLERHLIVGLDALDKTRKVLTQRLLPHLVQAEALIAFQQPIFGCTGTTSRKFLVVAHRTLGRCIGNNGNTVDILAVGLKKVVEGFDGLAVGEVALIEDIFVVAEIEGSRHRVGLLLLSPKRGRAREREEQRHKFSAMRFHQISSSLSLPDQTYSADVWVVFRWCTQ